jgi:hypothetical protein
MFTKGKASWVRIILVLVLILQPAVMSQLMGDATVSNNSTEVPANQFPPVGGVEITGGQFLITSHTTVDDSGGFHTTFHSHSQGVSGVGPGGAKYQIISDDSMVLNDPASPAEEATFIHHLKLVGQGKAPNFAAICTMHFTMNANGEMTSMVNTCD